MVKRYRCPCCRNYTYTQIPEKYDICPVCYWEIDILQENDETYTGGANRSSLLESKKNYELYGACEKEYISLVRQVNQEELCYEENM